MPKISDFKQGQRVKVVRSLISNGIEFRARVLVVDRVEIVHGCVVAGDSEGKWWLHPDCLEIVP